MNLLLLISIFISFAYGSDHCFCRDRVTGEDCSDKCGPKNFDNPIIVIPSGVETVKFPRHPFHFVHCEIHSRSDIVTSCIIGELAFYDFCAVELKYGAANRLSIINLYTSRVTDDYLLLNKESVDKECAALKQEQEILEVEIAERKKKWEQYFDNRLSIFHVLDQIVWEEQFRYSDPKYYEYLKRRRTEGQ